ncbi:hypothetical protein D3C78_20790 [compost metagenome]
METKESIKLLLSNNKNALYRGLITIYMMQTKRERAGGTSANNGVGFTKYDADVLSRIAEKVLWQEELTPKDQSLAKNKMMKYAGQLATLSNNGIKVQVDLFIKRFRNGEE